ncbi:MAG: TPM domain-containing protein [Candidatus Omnitrophota bacterium]
MKNRFSYFLIIAVVLILLSIPFAHAQGAKFPAYKGYVNDFAGVIYDDTEDTLSWIIGELEKKTTAQIAVVTLDTVSPLDIETYAVELFEEWGIGHKGRDNGVLFLVAVGDRKMRIEVGYGLEGAIPDALAKLIISKNITPYFKQGNYDRGIMAGTVAIANLMAKEYNIKLSDISGMPQDVSVPRKPTGLEAILNFLFTLFILFIFLSFRMGWFWFFFLPGTSRRRDGYWYGGGYGGNSGGFSGGFGGFGGGMSGGGGASGSW